MSEDEKIIERLEDTFYPDLGKGIKKNQSITLYEDSIQDVRKLLDLYQHKKGRVEELKEELLEEKEKNKEIEIRLQEEINEVCEMKTRLFGNSISKDKIMEMKRYREFELQQEYKDFENDSEWKTYNKILEEN